MEYKKANTDWMAQSKFGISVHWTTKSMPRHGEQQSFEDAVNAFNVDHFVDQVETTGADYLIFTTNHAECYFPGPVKIVDEILPGRAMKRDLVGEIAASLKKKGIRCMLYFNVVTDQEWNTALDYYNPKTFTPFVENLCRVIAGISEHYGDLLAGWWFDCGDYIDSTGPSNRMDAPSIQGKEYHFPWDKLTQASKAGGDDILVTYSCGANMDSFVYTQYQDYWHGERGYFKTPERNVRVPIEEICLIPEGRYHSSGLQWHEWTCLDNREWLHLHSDTDAADVLYSEKEVFDFIKLCNAKQAAITFNVEIFQSGEISTKAVIFLEGIKNALTSLGMRKK